MNHPRRFIAVAIASCLLASLSGCGGGGGGGTRASGGTSVVVTPPVTPPPTTPPPVVVPTLTEGPVGYTPDNAHITVARIPWARAFANNQRDSTLEGQGIGVGILDTGAKADNVGLTGRIAWYRNYAGTDTSTQDVDGHGSIVAQVLGGNPATDGNGRTLPGGVADLAPLYIARVLPDVPGTPGPDYTATALADMTAQGVRLFNHSYGQTTSITAAAGQEKDPASFVSYERGIFDPVVAKGTLHVWAAGNQGNAQPTIEAGLPALLPELEDHWLAVVGLEVDDKGAVIGLDKTAGAASNACGVAAAWCLAAPARAQVVPVAGTQFASGAADGTSIAAPIVTGVAAMVAQQFLWMDMTQVREVVLGTATPLGDPAIYGYGLVNAEAAINGPKRLDWGMFDVNIPANHSSLFYNNMTGTGGIHKTGGGEVLLVGQSDYTGGTVIDEGFLLLTKGASIRSDVTVGVDGKLDGVGGTVFGNVDNAGYLNYQGGPLAIVGDYTARQSSVTYITVGDPLSVDGKVTLEHASAAFTLPDSYVYKASEPVVRATKGLTGTFDFWLVFASVYTDGTLSYTANGVDIALTRTSATTVAAQAAPPSAANIQLAAVNVEKALQQADTWSVEGANRNVAFMAAASAIERTPTLEAAAASLDSLSGQIHASSQALTLQQAGIVNRALVDRLSDTNEGAGTWVQATGSNGDVGRSGFATGKFSGGGAMAGIDSMVGNGVTLGAALDWNRLNATYDGRAGKSDTRAQGVSFYARVDGEHAYLLGRVGQDWIRSTTDRWVLLGTTSASLDSIRDDRMTSLYIESGIGFGSTANRITPFVSAAANRLRRDDIHEDGAGGFGLDAHAKTMTQTAAQLGARWSHDFEWAGGESTVSAYGLWQHVVSGSDTSFDATFAGASAVDIHVEGARTPRDTGWLGVGMLSRFGRAWTWYANAGLQAGGGATRSRSLSVGLRWDI